MKKYRFIVIILTLAISVVSSVTKPMEDEPMEVGPPLYQQLYTKSWELVFRLTGRYTKELFEAVERPFYPCAPAEYPQFNFERIEQLLKQGANPNAKNNKGKPPLYSPALSQWADLVALLMQYGADPAIQDSSGWSTSQRVNYATQYYYDSVKRRSTPEVYAVVQALFGNDVDRTYQDGKKPMHYAARDSYVERTATLQTLIDRGADINAVDDNGNTPLHSAATRYIAEDRDTATACTIVKHMITLGADLYAQNNDDKIPVDIHSSAIRR